MTWLENSWTLLRLGLGVLAKPRLVILNKAQVLISAEEALGLARAKDFYALSNAQFEVPNPEAEARAFWLNLYNALTLHAIEQTQIQKTVLESIGFYARFAYLVGGHPYSLNDIEHGVLRANRAVFGRPPFASNDPRTKNILPFEARIHFALNCGATSCPPIRAYVGSNLEAQLELATGSYLQVCKLEAGVVWLPRLLAYYPQDFPKPLEFVRVYRPDLPQKSRIKYLPYSWKLEP
jgi:hypothetical protein